ncbi:MAG: 4-hydroxy-tetrahydrodipicolinate reductase, partial [Clostridia bacterium]|nr:4-hydroxy-tetrahydrodipicolinate reductase [Clostridia bacterium]
NLLMALSRKAAQILGDTFDVEIVEAHHNKKLDAPSGTALMLAGAVSQGLSGQPVYTYDRHSVRQERRKEEIGIHSIRGGTIVGEHSVIFAGKDEVLTLSHSAGSRKMFAAGAVNAAVYVADKSSGMYDMSALLGAL